MNEQTINVKSIEVSQNTLLAFFEGKGMTMAKQCNEGICGTCRRKVSNPDAFDEVHPQLGYKDDDEVLLCAVNLKDGEESDFFFPEERKGSDFYSKP